MRVSFCKEGAGPMQVLAIWKWTTQPGKLDDAGVHSTNRVGGKTGLGIRKPSSAFTGGVTSGMPLWESIFNKTF